MGATGVAGTGIPTGGTVGQYIRKASATNFDTAWDTITADDVSGLSASLSTLTSADASLTSRVSTEETTRATADTSLTTRLSTEEAARGSADTSIVTRFSTADTSLATAAAATYLPLAGGTMTGVLAFLAGTAALPGLAVAGDLNTGIYGVSADVLGVSAGGLNVASFTNGQLSLATAAGGAGVNLAVDGANTLALRNGANANTFRIYSTYTDASNYERLALTYSGGNFQLMANAAGTGSNRSLAFGTAGTERWFISGASGHYLAGADNTYDIGASGANRPRIIYVGTDVVVGNKVQAAGDVIAGGTGDIQLSGRFRMRSPGDGIITLYNAAATGFTGIKMGGVTASQPYLKVSGANLQGRLADDTDFNRFQAKLQTHANAVAETPTATHTLTLYDAAGTAYKVLAVAA
jgi:hypothetical protein